jgi:hypothetical protein
VVVETELDQTKPPRTEHEARYNEHDRRCEDGALQPPRNEAECEYDGSQHHEINHSILRWRVKPSSHKGESRSWIFDSLQLGPCRSGMLGSVPDDAGEHPSANFWYLCQSALPMLGLESDN